MRTLALICVSLLASMTLVRAEELLRSAKSEEAIKEWCSKLQMPIKNGYWLYLKTGDGDNELLAACMCYGSAVPYLKIYLYRKWEQQWRLLAVADSMGTPNKIVLKDGNIQVLDSKDEVLLQTKQPLWAKLINPAGDRINAVED